MHARTLCNVFVASFRVSWKNNLFFFQRRERVDASGMPRTKNVNMITPMFRMHRNSAALCFLRVRIAHVQIEKKRIT